MFRLLDVPGLEKVFSNGKGCVGTLQLIGHDSDRIELVKSLNLEYGILTGIGPYCL